MILHPGVQKQILKESPTIAGTSSVDLSIQSDAVLVTLYAPAVSATLAVTVYSLVDNQEFPLLLFPTLTGPTPTLLIKRSAVSPETIRIVATYTGACEYTIQARAVHIGTLELTFPDPAVVTIDEPTTPVVENVTVPLANTEVSYTFPPSTRQFRINARGNSRIQFAYISGDSGIKYLTIWPGKEYPSPLFTAGSVTSLYFQTSKAGEILEIESWS